MEIQDLPSPTTDTPALTTDAPAPTTEEPELTTDAATTEEAELTTEEAELTTEAKSESTTEAQEPTTEETPVLPPESTSLVFTGITEEEVMMLKKIMNILFVHDTGSHHYSNVIFKTCKHNVSAMVTY